jgi:hypothetical protein
MTSGTARYAGSFRDPMARAGPVLSCRGMRIQDVFGFLVWALIALAAMWLLLWVTRVLA